MFCPKCGKELSDDAGFCSACGKKLNGKSGKGLVLLGIVLVIIGLIAIGIGAVMLSKALKTPGVTSGNKVETVSTSKDVAATPDKAAKDTATVSESSSYETSTTVSKEEIIVDSFFEGPAYLELPSFVSFSKGRMMLGNYEEAKMYGGFVQMFEAGNDTNIVQCMAEYKDILSSYGATSTGTNSSNDGEYNYTCYTFTYSGEAAIKRGSIVYDNVSACDFCFVVATKEGRAYIAAYVPEGVCFVETIDKMKNSY